MVQPQPGSLLTPAVRQHADPSDQLGKARIVQERGAEEPRDEPLLPPGQTRSVRQPSASPALAPSLKPLRSALAGLGRTTLPRRRPTSPIRPIPVPSSPLSFLPDRRHEAPSSDAPPSRFPAGHRRPLPRPRLLPHPWIHSLRRFYHRRGLGRRRGLRSLLVRDRGRWRRSALSSRRWGDHFRRGKLTILRSDPQLSFSLARCLSRRPARFSWASGYPSPTRSFGSSCA